MSDTYNYLHFPNSFSFNGPISNSLHNQNFNQYFQRQDNTGVWKLLHSAVDDKAILVTFIQKEKIQREVR